MNIELLNENATLEEIVAKINELIEAKNSKKDRDYGPKSQNAMNDEMAWRIMFGDLKDNSVKEIANEFGFSRGQIYSLRGGYTFTYIKEDSFEADVDEELKELLKEA